MTASRAQHDYTFFSHSTITCFWYSTCIGRGWSGAFRENAVDHWCQSCVSVGGVPWLVRSRWHGGTRVLSYSGNAPQGLIFVAEYCDPLPSAHVIPSRTLPKTGGVGVCSAAPPKRERESRKRRVWRVREGGLNSVRS